MQLWTSISPPFSEMLPAVSFVTLSLIYGAYGAIGPKSNLFIVNENLAPDGFVRSTVVAGNSPTNGTFPGPLITANTHWHGFFQKGTSYADGPVGVNQCPIVPNNSFLYDFSVPGQAGTFWYHSHYSTQYCDGLRGAIVVYDPKDPYKSLYDVDDETTVITLADWYHVPAPSAGLVPKADSILINGLGRYVGGDATPLAVVNVVKGKRYRFRLVSISCDPNFIFSIDSHTLTVIEADAVNHQPVVVDSLQIFAGQRYSVILNANQTINNYWIRAQPNAAASTTFDGGLNSAILRYKGANITDPVTNSTLSNTLLETSLVPLTNPGAPGGSGRADVNLTLNIAFNGQFTINGATFAPPNVPVLLQIISGARLATDLLPAGSVYRLPPNKVIELVVPGGAAGAPHPFHLHGHTFDVVRSAGSSVYNYANPPRRDVVSTGLAGDNVTIRFQTDNSGPWILHCHIDWHLELGLAIVFAEDAATVATQNPPRLGVGGGKNGQPSTDLKFELMSTHVVLKLHWHLLLRSMSVIPQELIAHIIDFLHDCVPALKACSLVAHALVDSSRCHLFRHVTFADDDPRDPSASRSHQRVISLYEILKRSPALSKYVKTLTILHIATVGTLRPDLPLADLISRLPHLLYLKISILSSRSEPVVAVVPSNLACALQTLSSLVEAHFHGLTFSEPSEIIQILRSFPSLRRITLTNLEFRRPDMDHLPSSQSLKARPLELTTNDAILASLLVKDASPLDLSVLHSLDIRPTTTTYRTLAELLPITIMLQRFEVTLDADPDHVPAFDLALLKTLDTIVFRVRALVGRENPMPWLHTVLSSLPPDNTLQQLSLLVTIDMPPPDLTQAQFDATLTSWKQFDILFTEAKFLPLKRLRIDFCIDNVVGDVVVKSMVDEIIDELWRLDARGVLHVDSYETGF
ncbi:hypothetical protein H0H93_012536 [Arthromyces matolae]|nr:hypothetical protein H0H93_012536 [Arthromyces matolae]